MIKTYGNVALYGKELNTEYFSLTFNKHFHINVYSPSKGLFAVIFEDITQRKQTELQIKTKNEEIEAQNEEYLQINEELKQTNHELFLIKERAEKNERFLREAQGSSSSWYIHT